MAAASPLPIALAVVGALAIFVAWLPFAIRESRREIRWPTGPGIPSEREPVPLVAPPPPRARRDVPLVAPPQVVAPAEAAAAPAGALISDSPDPAPAPAPAERPERLQPAFAVPASRPDRLQPALSVAAASSAPATRARAARAARASRPAPAATGVKSPARQLRYRVVVVVAAFVLWSRWTSSHRSRSGGGISHH